MFINNYYFLVNSYSSRYLGTFVISALIFVNRIVVGLHYMLLLLVVSGTGGFGDGQSWREIREPNGYLRVSLMNQESIQ